MRLSDATFWFVVLESLAACHSSRRTAASNLPVGVKDWRCSLGLQVLHSSSPVTGRLFEKKSRRDGTRIAVMSVDGQPVALNNCRDALFEFRVEEGLEQSAIGNRVGFNRVDGGFLFYAQTESLNLPQPDSGSIMELELSGTFMGLALEADAGWVICHDCEAP